MPTSPRHDQQQTNRDRQQQSPDTKHTKDDRQREQRQQTGRDDGTRKESPGRKG
jgi:hypothetical protein